MLVYLKNTVSKSLTSKSFHLGSPRYDISLKNKKLRGSSRNWILRHLQDPYVKLASNKNYRARSAFKLLEIDEKFKIFKKGYFVLDCGAAPGSWSQVALEQVGREGRVVAIDINYFEEIVGVNCIPFQDINNDDLTQKLTDILSNRLKITPHPKFDIILSDMAPNASGINAIDHEIISNLCLTTYNICLNLLENGGSFVCKIWNGYRDKEIREKLTSSFEQVKNFKPHSSRDESAESYFVCKGFKNHTENDEL